MKKLVSWVLSVSSSPVFPWLHPTAPFQVIPVAMTNVMEPHGTDDRRTDSHRDRQEDTCTVVLTRGSSQGFGFSLTGSDPVVISRVEKGKDVTDTAVEYSLCKPSVYCIIILFHSTVQFHSYAFNILKSMKYRCHIACPWRRDLLRFCKVAVWPFSYLCHCCPVCHIMLYWTCCIAWSNISWYCIMRLWWIN